MHVAVCHFILDKIYLLWKTDLSVVKGNNMTLNNSQKIFKISNI